MTTVNTTGGAKPATILLDGVDGLPYSDTRPLPIRPGSGAADIGKAEDAPHASGDVGVMSLAVRKDTPTPLAGADGDYAPLEVDSAGYLYTRQVDDAWVPGTVLSASGNTVTGLGRCKQLVITNAHATNAISATVYDGTSTSGTLKFGPVSVGPNSTLVVPCNFAFGTGVHLAFSGTGTPGGVAMWV